MLVDPNRAVAFMVEHEIPGDDAETLVGFLVCGDLFDFGIDEGRHRFGRVTDGPLMISITTRTTTTAAACPSCSLGEGGGGYPCDCPAACGTRYCQHPAETAMPAS
jgi:hypothetical protein